MDEIWKDIPGWEGCYRISSFGNLYSYHHKKILGVNLNTAGYRIKTLYDCKTKRKVPMLVHRLVMLTFAGEPTVEKPHVNHIDGNPLNNRLANLEYCSHQENMNHAWATGLCTTGHMKSPDWHLRKSGDEHPKTKWSDELKAEIVAKYESGVLFSELMIQYPDVPKCTLWSFISGRRK